MNNPVMVIPTEKFVELYQLQGFTTRVKSFESLINDHSFFRDRYEVENDLSLKQIITYGLIRYNNRYFSYQRKSRNESRLNALYSIGVGGHVEALDKKSDISTLYASIRREVQEEITVTSLVSNRLIGIINDDSNDVGKVHVGAVFLIDVNTKAIFPKEESLINCDFYNLDDLKRSQANYENWSQICIDYLYNHISGPI